MDFSAFEQATGITFTDKELLKQAFTHRSYINEHRGVGVHNERLEFLGDAVLQLIITDHIYSTYPDVPEGTLTAYRAALVNSVTLSQVAEEIGVNDFLLLSKGEAKDINSRARGYILADTYEAIVGAIHLDQGYAVAKQFVEQTIFPKLESVIAEESWKDAKSRFQELAQEHTSTTPVYKTTEERGPDHDKWFKVAVFVGDEQIAEGGGASKQDAEQEAAQKALDLKKWG